MGQGLHLTHSTQHRLGTDVLQDSVFQTQILCSFKIFKFKIFLWEKMVSKINITAWMFVFSPQIFYFKNFKLIITLHKPFVEYFLICVNISQKKDHSMSVPYYWFFQVLIVIFQYPEPGKILKTRENCWFVCPPSRVLGVCNTPQSNRGSSRRRF